MCGVMKCAAHNEEVTPNEADDPERGISPAAFVTAKSNLDNELCMHACMHMHACMQYMHASTHVGRIGFERLASPSNPIDILDSYCPVYCS